MTTSQLYSPSKRWFRLRLSQFLQTQTHERSGFFWGSLSKWLAIVSTHRIPLFMLAHYTRYALRFHISALFGSVYLTIAACFARVVPYPGNKQSPFQNRTIGMRSLIIIALLTCLIAMVLASPTRKGNGRLFITIFSFNYRWISDKQIFFFIVNNYSLLYLFFIFFYKKSNYVFLLQTTSIPCCPSAADTVYSRTESATASRTFMERTARFVS